MSRTQDLARARLRMMAGPRAAASRALDGRGTWPGGPRPAVGRPDPGSGPGTAARDPGSGPEAAGAGCAATPDAWAEPTEVDPDPGGAADPAGRREDGIVAERMSLAPGLRLLGAVIALALALGGWMLVRAWPRAVAEPAPPGVSTPTDSVTGPPIAPLAGPPATGAPGADPLGAAAAPPEPAPTLVVHVAGEVRRPGIVMLPAGSRVGDAVEAAGGLSRGGSVGPANLARPLVDGERVEIGPQAAAAPMPPGAVGSAGSGTGADAPGRPLDLNTATEAQLDELPGIGPVTAAKILAWRAVHGRFTIIDELAEIPGIGPRTLEELRPHVRV
jgi:competence protein ComEA